MENLFNKGISFRSYIFNLEDKYKYNTMKYYIPMEISKEVSDKIKQINKKIKILAVVDQKSPDCHINLSILEKMISTHENINLKLVTRSILSNELDKYKVDGFIRIPTFIFMDKDFNIIDAFVEKPEILKKINVNTIEGSKMNIKYMMGKLVDETSKEILQKLLKVWINFK